MLLLYSTMEKVWKMENEWNMMNVPVIGSGIKKYTIVEL